MNSVSHEGKMVWELAFPLVLFCFSKYVFRKPHVSEKVSSIKIIIIIIISHSVGLFNHNLKFKPFEIFFLQAVMSRQTPEDIAF